MPKDFVATATTPGCKVAAYKHKTKSFFAIQFHPEVTHTKNGKKILSNFVFNICKAPKDWKIDSVAKNIIADIKAQVGKDHVLVGISGGVDSLVAATLLHKAIGKQLHAVFVDPGILRKNEVKSVEEALKKKKV